MAAVAADSDAVLCARVRAGRDAADTLARRHERLVWSCVHRLKLPDWIDQDDLFQAGSIALAHAASKWRPDGGTKFSTYARTAIWNAVVRAAQSEQKKTTSLDDRPMDPDGSDLLNTLATREPTEPPEWVAAGVARLSPVLRRVVSLRFGLEGEPLNWKEVSTVTGLSMQAAQRALELALAQLDPKE